MSAVGHLVKLRNTGLKASYDACIFHGAGKGGVGEEEVGDTEFLLEFTSN